MHKFIKEHIRYPLAAFNKGIEGRVVTRFLVRKTGDIDSIRVIKGIHPECDSVAINIIKKMPKWNPGGMSGKGGKADIWYTLPIVFKLPKELTKSKDNLLIDYVETLPVFLGGEKELTKYLSEKAKRSVDGGQYDTGRVLVHFTVTKKGKVTDPVIVKGINKFLDKEAVDIVLSMPDWTPAKQNGVNVSYRYIVPVVFKLPGL